MLSKIFLKVAVTSVPTGLSSVMQEFRSTKLDAGRYLGGLSCTMTPFLFTIGLVAGVSPFSSFTMMLLVTLLFSTISFFLLFVVLVKSDMCRSRRRRWKVGSFTDLTGGGDGTF